MQNTTFQKNWFDELEILDEKVFEKLYDIFLPKIYKFIFLKVGNQNLAEDLTSEVFLRAFENLKFFSGGSFGSWIYKIASNKVIDFFRSKENLVKKAELDEAIEFHSTENNFENLEDEERLLMLSKNIEKLPEVQQKVVLMRFSMDMKNKEIANELNVSEKTVASNLVRAIKNLQKFFGLEL